MMTHPETPMPPRDRTQDIRTWAAMRLMRQPDPSDTDLRAAVRWAERVDAALVADARAFEAVGAAPMPAGNRLRDQDGDWSTSSVALPGRRADAPAAPTEAAAPSEPAAPKRRPGRPRQDGSLSAYDRLSEQQRAAFDLVRTGYRLPTDREGAAATWAVLRPDPATAARILAAAIADAAQADPTGRLYRTGQGRRYLMRWLRDRGWEEGTTTPDGRPALAPADQARRREVLALGSQIAGLDRQIQWHRREGRPVPVEIQRDHDAAVERLRELQPTGREAA